MDGLVDPLTAGLRGVQDLTFTVADMEEASGFFQAVFGAEVVSESGPVSDRHRSTMRDLANVDVRAEIRRSRLLRTPYLNLCLLEGSYPGQRVVWPQMLDVGGWHLAAYVEDMDEAVRYIESCGVYVLGPGKKPTTNPPEVGEGSYACHCMTPWGFHFELTSYPNGRAYMDDSDRRLWNPSRPDRGATRREPGRPSVPGFVGFEHLSFAVADLDETTRFLEEVLGCERFYDMGPVADPHGSGFGAYANVDVRAKVSTVRVFRTPYLNFEVIEAEFPRQNRLWPALLDIGGWRLTFATRDIEGAVDVLRQGDVHLLGAVHPDQISGGIRASFLTPFGLYFDLLQGPAVRAGDAVAWHPEHPES